MQYISTSSVNVSATPVEIESSWQDRANCLGVDPDLFFPERGASTREAKEVCRSCEVQPDCLEFALQNGEKFGIWGGLSERERRRVRRQRAQVARSTIGAVMTGQEELMGSITDFNAPLDTGIIALRGTNWKKPATFEL